MPEDDKLNAEELETEVTTEEVEQTDNNVTEEEPTFTDSKKEEVETITKTKEEYQKDMESRLARQKKFLEKEFKKELDKYKELEYLTQQGIGGKDFDDTLNKTRDYYGEKGIKYQPKADARDIEVLANADVQDIIESCDTTEELEKEVKKYTSKENLTDRESLVLTKLQDSMANQKRIASLETIGASKEVYESETFKNFANDFNKNKPIEEIYDMYMKLNSVKKQSAGSLKSEPAPKGIKDFYTYEEASKLTVEDFNKNPGLLEAVEKSQLKW